MTTIPIPILSPEDALAHWRGKGVRISDAEFRKRRGVLHEYAFTIAGNWKIGALMQVKNSLEAALKKGESFAQWKKRIPAQRRAIKPHRLQMIFRTNMNSALLAGRRRAILQNAANRPYLMYDGIMDSRIRPEHATLDGLIRPVNDPIWNRIFPPNGYNCRCSVIALSDDDLRREGLRLSPKMPSAAAARHVSPDFLHPPGRSLRAVAIQSRAKNLSNFRDTRKAATGWRNAMAAGGAAVAAEVAADWQFFVRAVVAPRHSDSASGTKTGKRFVAALPPDAQAKLGAGLALVSDADIKDAARSIIRAEFGKEMLEEIKAGGVPVKIGKDGKVEKRELKRRHYQAIMRARRRVYGLPRSIAAGEIRIHKKNRTVAFPAEGGGWWIGHLQVFENRQKSSRKHKTNQAWSWQKQLRNEKDWQNE